MKPQEAFNSYNASRLSEPDLQNYFVKTDFYEKIVRDDNYCIISGIKGIGKTATFRALSEFDDKSDIVIKLHSDTYIVEVPIQNSRSSVFSYEFEYELTIEFLKAVVQETRLHNRIKPKYIKDAKKYVHSFFDDLKEVGGNITGISVLGCGLNISSGASKILTSLKGREEEVNARKLLKNIADSGIKMRIVIDDPEDIFVQGRTIDYSMIGGLCLAISRLNEYSVNIRGFLLIKTHIYDEVIGKTPDLDKYPNSHLRICWDKDSLKKVLKSRVQYFLESDLVKWEESLFTEESLTQLDEIYSLIFNNVRNGPREMLFWIHSALEYNHKLGIMKLDKRSLVDTIISVSNKSFSYFSSSYGEELHEIGKIISIVFSKDVELEYTPSEMSQLIREIKGTDKDFQNLENKEGWIQALVSSGYPELFLQVGCINLINQDGSQIYPYMCNYTLDDFRKSKKFRLTPMFKHYLATL